MAQKVRIKKSDDVCLNCIAFVLTNLEAKDGTPLGECRRVPPKIVWHFDAKDIATSYPFVAVNSKCLAGVRKDGETFLARVIERNKKGSKK